jgi:uncharacterized protein YecT (DUF1311 family)
MQTLLRALILSVATLAQSVIAQVPTQEQLQAADAQLNQVYQQLRGTLNDTQKQQLKLAQRDWIKKRDASVAANSDNAQGALYQATIERVGVLRGILDQSTFQKTTHQVSRSDVASEQLPIPESSLFPSAEDDAELNAVYYQLNQYLDYNQKDILKKAQRDWLKYRDARIKGDKSPKKIAEANIRQLIQLRIKDFKNLYKEIGNGFEKEISIQTIKRLGDYNYYFNELALNGDPYAQGLLAINIYEENGQNKNIDLAIKYAAASCKAGNPFGLYLRKTYREWFYSKSAVERRVKIAE